MKRKTCPQRTGWQQRAEERGLIFHTPTGDDGAPAKYWNEGVYYSFTMAEVEAIEKATGELHEMCLAAVRRIVETRRYTDLDPWEAMIPLMAKSFGEPSLYGRMDFAFGADGVPKLLEYNADTPTSLLEAAVIQWDWLQDSFPKLDQFNSLHEKLVARWSEVTSGLVHFAHLDNPEDAMTVGYLRDTAMQSGLGTSALWMKEIGWNGEALTDLEERRISKLFKLYPWEWLMSPEDGGLAERIPGLDVQFIEPAWKAMLSCKGILPILWEMYPNHPNLLPAYDDSCRGMMNFVEKPFYSREGQNVTLVKDGLVALCTDGESADERMIWQERADLFESNGQHAVIGSWIVGDEPAGMGIRESASPVTGNLAMFVPHVIEEAS